MAELQNTLYTIAELQNTLYTIALYTSRIAEYTLIEKVHYFAIGKRKT